MTPSLNSPYQRKLYSNMHLIVFSHRFVDGAPDDKLTPSFTVSSSLVWLLPSPGEGDARCVVPQSDRCVEFRLLNSGLMTVSTCDRANINELL